MADRVEFRTVIDTVLAAQGEAAWQRSLERLGPGFRGDLALIRQVHEEIAVRRGAGDVEAATTLGRWIEDAFRDAEGPGTGPLIQQLLGLESEREIDRLLAENQGRLGPAAVRSALNEIPHLLAPNSPFPPPMAVMVVGRILRVNLRLSKFLGDDNLYADCLMARSQILFMQEEPDAAISDLREAIDLYQQVGDALGAGRCLGIVGSYLREQGRIDDALPYLLQAEQSFLRQDKTTFLGKTYQDIGLIYQQKGQMQAAREALEKAARMRIENRQWQ
jgi:tetratricopeptide (TPR) repeat protein